jgi:hypothetical protein
MVDILEKYETFVEEFFQNVKQEYGGNEINVTMD